MLQQHRNVAATRAIIAAQRYRDASCSVTNLQCCSNASLHRCSSTLPLPSPQSSRASCGVVTFDVTVLISVRRTVVHGLPSVELSSTDFRPSNFCPSDCRPASCAPAVLRPTALRACRPATRRPTHCRPAAYVLQSYVLLSYTLTSCALPSYVLPSTSYLFIQHLFDFRAIFVCHGSFPTAHFILQIVHCVKIL